jgi:hypothetical protein
MKESNGKGGAHETDLKENWVAVIHLSCFGIGELATIGQRHCLAHVTSVVEARSQSFDVHCDIDACFFNSD